MHVGVMESACGKIPCPPRLSDSGQLSAIRFSMIVFILHVASLLQVMGITATNHREAYAKGAQEK